MKLLYIFFLSLPFFAFAQDKPGYKNKAASKTTVKSTIVAENPELKGFIITGTVTGFTDGTPVSFLNEQTGQPEQQATMQAGKFTIKGNLDQPGFKGLIFANAQPLIPLFLDNSKITILGSKNALDKLVITGSPSHKQFTEYTDALKPYEKLFDPEAERDSAAINMVKNLSGDFVKKNPDSYVSPLAIIRLFQVSEDGVKAGELYELLAPQVKLSSLGTYANQQIQESKINALGSTVSDFSQEDTAGNKVSLSSFRGQYVLIDFWASWCRPCRQENPNVVAAYQKYKGKSFTVLGVSLDQAKQAWLNAIQMDNLEWSHVSDLKGWGNTVAAQFKVKSIPQNFLIDPQGRIIAKNLRGDILDKKLEEVLK